MSRRFSPWWAALLTPVFFALFFGGLAALSVFGRLLEMGLVEPPPFGWPAVFAFASIAVFFTLVVTPVLVILDRWRRR